MIDILNKKPSECTDIELSNYVVKLQDIETTINNFKKELRDRCKKNGHCGNHKMLKVDGSREITNIVEAFRKLTPVLPANVFLSTCKVSITKLENEYHKHINEAPNNNELYSKTKTNEMLTEVLGDSLGRGSQKDRMVLIG